MPGLPEVRQTQLVLWNLLVKRQAQHLLAELCQLLARLFAAQFSGTRLLESGPEGECCSMSWVLSGRTPSRARASKCSLKLATVLSSRRFFVFASSASSSSVRRAPIPREPRRASAKMPEMPTSYEYQWHSCHSMLDSPARAIPHSKEKC